MLLSVEGSILTKIIEEILYSFKKFLGHHLRLAYDSRIGTPCHQQTDEYNTRGYLSDIP